MQHPLFGLSHARQERGRGTTSAPLWVCAPSTVVATRAASKSRLVVERQQQRAVVRAAASGAQEVMESTRVARLPAGAAACSDAGAGAFTGLGPPAARFTPLVGASSIGVSCVDETAASAAGSAGGDAAGGSADAAAAVAS